MTLVTTGQRFAETNTGRRRRRNEDAYVCEPPLFAVADGMGGAQAGELASSVATESLVGAFRDGGGDGNGSPELRVVELIQEANRRVHLRAIRDAAASGMGTTMTVALVGDDGRVAIGHVGDSRAYRLREGRLEQLTEDHSLVAELVRRGELSPAEAETHPQRSVITRALGTDPSVDVDAFSVEARFGDVFLLCSDGLTTMVDEQAIAGIVEARRDDLQQAARTLIRAANDGGGEDNITAVLFDIVDGAAAAAGTTVVQAGEGAAGFPGDDEDTLHPEDDVRLPADDEGPTFDTVIVPASALSPPSSPDAAAPAPAPAPAPAAEPEATLARKLLVSLVIAGLVALIVFLTVRGLAH